MAITIGLATSGFAQATPNIDQGTKEIAGSGVYNTETPGGDLFAIDLSYGYFVRDQFQVLGSVGVKDDDLTTTWNVGAVAEYNFLPDGWGAWVPYLAGGIFATGSDISRSTIDSDETTGNLRGSLGIKYFVHDNVALGLEGRYNYAFDDVYFSDDGKLSDDQFLTVFSIRVYYD
jgi:hypothetical protein